MHLKNTTGWCNRVRNTSSGGVKQLKFPFEHLKTEDVQVITPNNERINYVDLAEDAARIDPPKIAKTETQIQIALPRKVLTPS